MIAGAMPRSLKMLKKVMITVATATIPKSEGDSRRASTPETASEMTMPAYLAIAM